MLAKVYAIVLFSAIGLVASHEGVDSHMVELSEEGYQAVVLRKSDEDMKAFILRMLTSMHLEVAGEGELSGFVPWVSGTSASQDFARLQSALQVAAWVRPATVSEKVSGGGDASTKPTAGEAKVESQTGRGRAAKQRGTQASLRGQGVRKNPSRVHTEHAKRNAKKGTAAQSNKVSLIANANEPKEDQSNKKVSSIANVEEPKEEPKVGNHTESNITAQPHSESQPASSLEPQAEVSVESQTQTSADREKSQLPAVDSVLSKASDVLHDFESQAKTMQLRLAQKQASSRAALIAEKAKFKKHLQAQRTTNLELMQESENLRVNISQSLKLNTALEDNAAKLREAIDHMRGVASSLKQKTKVALEFLDESINSTNDNQAEELSVLHPSTPKPDLDYYLSIARTQLGLGNKTKDLVNVKGLSFLQVKNPLDEDNEQKTEAEPNRLVSLLSQSLDKLDKADAKAKEALKTQFEKLSARETGKYNKLVETKEALDDERAKTQERHAQLLIAKNHLQGTFEQIQTRLTGLGVFAKKVDAAMSETLTASQQEMHHL